MVRMNEGKEIEIYADWRCSHVGLGKPTPIPHIVELGCVRRSRIRRRIALLGIFKHITLSFFQILRIKK